MRLRVALPLVMIAALVLTPGFSANPVLAAPAAVAPQSPCGSVTTNSDNGAGSLRSIVSCTAPGGTVTFAAALANATILLTTGEITITQSLTIDGSAAPGIIVDAGGLSRVFNVATSGAVTLTNLIIQRGLSASSSGGAVLAVAGGPLTLSHVQVLSSTATTGVAGGVYAGG